MNREPRSHDIVRINRGAPEVVREITDGKLTLVGIDGEGTRTIPCPPPASIILVGAAYPRAKRRAKTESVPIPETTSAPKTAIYGTQGLDLSSVF